MSGEENDVLKKEVQEECKTRVPRSPNRRFCTRTQTKQNKKTKTKRTNKKTNIPLCFYDDRKNQRKADSFQEEAIRLISRQLASHIVED